MGWEGVVGNEEEEEGIEKEAAMRGEEPRASIWGTPLVRQPGQQLEEKIRSYPLSNCQSQTK